MVTALRYGVDDHGTRNTMPPLTRDFTGSDAPGKVIIASRDGGIRPGLFFTAYINILQIVGISYQRYKIYDIFISFFFRNCIFMFFKNLILIYAWKSLPPSKEMSPENVKTCE